MYANESELDSHPLNVTTTPAPILGAIFGCFSAIALVANFVLFVYIISHRLYRNFISSHFIAHLCITNAVALCALLPMFVYNVWTGYNIWAYSNVMCRVQALLTCSVWTVMQFMALCIAGVHLLTFARIHYEQLFGLPPNMLCALAWLIAFGLALPTITNGHIVIYDPALRHCVWGDTDSGLKFLTYLLILGVFIPASLASYAYIRVLGILYHSPIVFQSIGLYKSRFLVYAFLLSPFYQLPFYAITMVSEWRQVDTTIPLIFMFLAYTQCIVSPGLYGASLFLMKEEDMALTARAHKAPNSHQLTQHL
uniref:G-protein coupled receptors family 1 profile domain-containing protein n=3 Tax=Ascarididae TaxID=6250 RepID=A0A915ACA4_PARUN